MIKTIFEKQEIKEDYLWLKQEHLFLVEKAWTLYSKKRKPHQKEFAQQVMKEYKEFEEKWKEKKGDVLNSERVSLMRDLVKKEEELLKLWESPSACENSSINLETTNVSSQGVKPLQRASSQQELDVGISSSSSKEASSQKEEKKSDDLVYKTKFITSEIQPNMIKYLEKVVKKIPQSLWETIGWHLVEEANKQNKPPVLPSFLKILWERAKEAPKDKKVEVSSSTSPLGDSQTEEESFLEAFGSNY